MDIQVFASQAADTRTMAREIAGAIAAHNKAPPDFVALHLSALYDIDAARTGMETAKILHGATSCKGVMTDKGLYTQGGIGAGAFCIWDADGDYGSACVAAKDNPKQAAVEATLLALKAAGRSGESPMIIWLSTSPGAEEAVLVGIESVVGKRVPILGGSAADNDISGNWQVFDKTQSVSSGVTVSVLFPSTDVSFSYHNGYAPTDISGVVTKVAGRLLCEIDNRPAAQVLDEWTQGAVIPHSSTGPVSILSESTLSPLGRYLDDVRGLPYFLLAHPSEVYPDGSIGLFADVQLGETLTLMEGSIESLTARAGKVASLSAKLGNMASDDISGGLMVYCGGCMLAVEDHMEDVISGVQRALPATPFLGVFTFGEQGVVIDGSNHHGNLMISCILFSKT
ncbi:MAG: FIST C-terminal domain-containing protein [Rhodobacteraceae bacterium]|nr:FIST C-terminal domain-containing protein [Paracoccaceae bacterium]